VDVAYAKRTCTSLQLEIKCQRPGFVAGDAASETSIRVFSCLSFPSYTKRTRPGIILCFTHWHSIIFILIHLPVKHNICRLPIRDDQQTSTCQGQSGAVSLSAPSLLVARNCECPNCLRCQSHGPSIHPYTITRRPHHLPIDAGSQHHHRE
jgi:hypothetical protein